MKKISLAAIAMVATVFLGAGCTQTQPLVPGVTGNVPGKEVANAPSSPDKTGSAAKKIEINNFAFNPATVTISVNDSVIWTNNDNADHTIVVDKGDGPVSTAIGRGMSYEYVFKKSGTYSYHCGIHPSMKGSVIVNP